MKILHLNGNDIHGGAERVVSGLVRAQNSAGHFSTALVGTKTDPTSESVAISRLSRGALPADLADYPDYDILESHSLPQHPLVSAADLLHLHNLYGGWFNPWSLIALSHFRPVIWTLHDMQPLSGYCSHSLECKRWESGCGQCPDLTLPGPRLTRDITADLWRDKSVIYSNSRLHLVACSNWAAERIQRSSLKAHPLTVIPNAVDTEIFSPRDKVVARQRLGIPTNALVIGGSASQGVLDHPWKGGAWLRVALEEVWRRHPQALLLNVGCARNSEHPKILNIPFQRGEESMAWIYAAMDVLVFPSIAENAPLTTLEAMACGVPVVASDVGGIPEQITHGRHGFLVPARNELALSQALLAALDDGEWRKQAGTSARNQVVENFGFQKWADSYDRLYKQECENDKGERVRVDLLKSMVLSEQSRLAAETKLKAEREKRAKDVLLHDSEIQRVLGQPSIRAMVSLGLVTGEFRRWWRKRLRKNKKT